MPRHVIINADDFGISAEISRGIIRAISAGPVKSTSVMTNGRQFRASMEMLDVDCDIGLHVNLTYGDPVSSPQSVKSIVNANGRFYSPQVFYLKVLAGMIHHEDVRRELHAQCDLLKKTGKPITHINGHHHIHILPVIRDVVGGMMRDLKIRFARCMATSHGHIEGNLPRRFLLGSIRGAHQKYWRALGIEAVFPVIGHQLYGGDGLLQRWDALLAGLSDEITEIMVHPGFVDDSLDDDYVHGRLTEVDVLCSPELSDLMKKHDVLPVSFSGFLRSRATGKTQGT